MVDVYVVDWSWDNVPMSSEAEAMDHLARECRWVYLGWAEVCERARWCLSQQPRSDVVISREKMAPEEYATYVAQEDHDSAPSAA